MPDPRAGSAVALTGASFSSTDSLQDTSDRVVRMVDGLLDGIFSLRRRLPRLVRERHRTRDFRRAHAPGKLGRPCLVDAQYGPDCRRCDCGDDLGWRGVDALVEFVDSLRG